MYTRSYYQDSAGGVPKGYDGNAFRIEDSPTVVTPTYGETKVSPEYMSEEGSVAFEEAVGEDEMCKTEESASAFSHLISRFQIKKLPSRLSGIFGRVGKIEFEDIIIISVALLLLFSGEGDKLFGIALLALLFV